MEERTRFQKIVLFILAAMIAVFGVLTGVTRSREGVVFGETLLKRTVTPDQTVYTGKISGGNVTVTVRNDGGSVTTVTCKTDTVQDVYTLEYPLDPVQTEHGPVDGVRILKNGKVLFQGGYAPHQTYGWYDTGGEWDPGVTITVGDGSAGAPTDLDRWDVMYFAQGPELTARGSWLLYLMMVFLTLLLALDVAYPTVLFYLNHCCDVRDPEPSDFYLAAQKVGWAVYPLLLLLGYSAALRQFP